MWAYSGNRVIIRKIRHNKRIPYIKAWIETFHSVTCLLSNLPFRFFDRCCACSCRFQVHLGTFVRPVVNYRLIVTFWLWNRHLWCVQFDITKTHHSSPVVKGHIRVVRLWKTSPHSSCGSVEERLDVCGLSYQKPEYPYQKPEYHRTCLINHPTICVYKMK